MLFDQDFAYYLYFFKTLILTSSLTDCFVDVSSEIKELLQLEENNFFIQVLVHATPDEVHQVQYLLQICIYTYECV